MKGAGGEQTLTQCVDICRGRKTTAKAINDRIVDRFKGCLKTTPERTVRRILL